MSAVMDRVYDALTSRLPPIMAGRVDVLRPGYRIGCGGPLNGQERRQETVRELARSINFDRVIETGTHRGTSTEFFTEVVDAPVDTVESNPRLYGYSRARLRAHARVSVVLGDSRSFLQNLAARSGAGDETVLIYLDAHWGQDLPLAEELRIIARWWERAVVMIDDYQVPGDPGYHYDDYGQGKALTDDYLPTDELMAWRVFRPRAPSDQETGERRGSVVLASPKVAPTVANLHTLREDRAL